MCEQWSVKLEGPPPKIDYDGLPVMLVGKWLGKAAESGVVLREIVEPHSLHAALTAQALLDLHEMSQQQAPVPPQSPPTIE